MRILRLDLWLAVAEALPQIGSLQSFTMDRRGTRVTDQTGTAVAAALAQPIARGMANGKWQCSAASAASRIAIGAGISIYFGKVIDT